MARRSLLTDEERRLLFGIPNDSDALARHYTYIADAIAHLRAAGKPAPDASLAHTSPLSWEHISLSGDFLWDRAAATADKRRPLNLGRLQAAA